jgi:hypothetical protein
VYNFHAYLFLIIWLIVFYLEIKIVTGGVATKLPVVVGVAVRLIMVTGGLAE